MAEIRLTLKSGQLGKQTNVNIILPNVVEKGEKLPVLYLLHGRSDNETAWTSLSSIGRYVLNKKVIVVMPNGDKSFYCDIPNVGNYFSYITKELPDFIEAVLRAAGKTEADALAGNWEFSDVQLENLGKMEHARWNAFHFCMGFMPMSSEEYAARTQIYQEQRRASGKGRIRIGKNLDARTHACLISWDALDALSEKENAITGGKVDYKQMDKNNILLLPELFRIRDGKTE